MPQVLPRIVVIPPLSAPNPGNPQVVAGTGPTPPPGGGVVVGVFPEVAEDPASRARPPHAAPCSDGDAEYDPFADSSPADPVLPRTVGEVPSHEDLGRAPAPSNVSGSNCGTRVQPLAAPSPDPVLPVASRHDLVEVEGFTPTSPVSIPGLEIGMQELSLANMVPPVPTAAPASSSPPVGSLEQHDSRDNPKASPKSGTGPTVSPSRGPNKVRERPVSPSSRTQSSSPKGPPAKKIAYAPSLTVNSTTAASVHHDPKRTRSFLSPSVSPRSSTTGAPPAKKGLPLLDLSSVKRSVSPLPSAPPAAAASRVSSRSSVEGPPPKAPPPDVANGTYKLPPSVTGSPASPPSDFVDDAAPVADSSAPCAAPSVVDSSAPCAAPSSVVAPTPSVATPSVFAPAPGDCASSSVAPVSVDSAPVAAASPAAVDSAPVSAASPAAGDSAPCVVIAKFDELSSVSQVEVCRHYAISCRILEVSDKNFRNDTFLASPIWNDWSSFKTGRYVFDKIRLESITQFRLAENPGVETPNWVNAVPATPLPTYAQVFAQQRMTEYHPTWVLELPDGELRRCSRHVVDAIEYGFTHTFYHTATCAIRPIDLFLSRHYCPLDYPSVEWFNDPTIHHSFSDLCSLVSRFVKVSFWRNFDWCHKAFRSVRPDAILLVMRLAMIDVLGHLYGLWSYADCKFPNIHVRDLVDSLHWYATTRVPDELGDFKVDTHAAAHDGNSNSQPLLLDLLGRAWLFQSVRFSIDDPFFLEKCQSQFVFRRQVDCVFGCGRSFTAREFTFHVRCRNPRLDNYCSHLAGFFAGHGRAGPTIWPTQLILSSPPRAVLHPDRNRRDAPRAAEIPNHPLRRMDHRIYNNGMAVQVWDIPEIATHSFRMHPVGRDESHAKVFRFPATSPRVLQVAQTMQREGHVFTKSVHGKAVEALAMASGPSPSQDSVLPSASVSAPCGSSCSASPAVPADQLGSSSCVAAPAASCVGSPAAGGDPSSGSSGVVASAVPSASCAAPSPTPAPVSTPAAIPSSQLVGATSKASTVAAPASAPAAAVAAAPVVPSAKGCPPGPPPQAKSVTTSPPATVPAAPASAPAAKASSAATPLAAASPPSRLSSTGSVRDHVTQELNEVIEKFYNRPLGCYPVKQLLVEIKARIEGLRSRYCNFPPLNPHELPNWDLLYEEYQDRLRPAAPPGGPPTSTAAASQQQVPSSSLSKAPPPSTTTTAPAQPSSKADAVIAPPPKVVSAPRWARNADRRDPENSSDDVPSRPAGSPLPNVRLPPGPPPKGPPPSWVGGSAGVAASTPTTTAQGTGSGHPGNDGQRWASSDPAAHHPDPDAAFETWQFWVAECVRRSKDAKFIKWDSVNSVWCREIMVPPRFGPWGTYLNEAQRHFLVTNPPTKYDYVLPVYFYNMGNNDQQQALNQGGPVQPPVVAPPQRGVSHQGSPVTPAPVSAPTPAAPAAVASPPSLQQPAEQSTVSSPACVERPPAPPIPSASPAAVDVDTPSVPHAAPACRDGATDAQPNRDLGSCPTADQVALETLKTHYETLLQGKDDRIRLLTSKIHEMEDSLRAMDHQVQTSNRNKELAITAYEALQEETGGRQAVALLRTDLERAQYETSVLQARVFELHGEVYHLRRALRVDEHVRPPIQADEENPEAVMSVVQDQPSVTEPESEHGDAGAPPANQPDSAPPLPPPPLAAPSEPEHFAIHQTSDPEVDVSSEAWSGILAQATGMNDYTGPPSAPTPPDWD